MTTVSDTCALLQKGDVEVLGQLPYSSNYVFLGRVCGSGLDALAVYKPTRGERPLWDFRTGSLAARERAAFLVSEAVGWGFVPPTVLRRNAPMGEGSLQLFVEHDPERHYLVLMQERIEDFASFAAFDVVINNADRKSGHILEDAQGRLWGVDHGVCFNAHPKLRTVIWAFADQRLKAPERDKLAALEEQLSQSDGLGGELARLLSARESAATLARARSVLEEGRFPLPGDNRPLPWPLV